MAPRITNHTRDALASAFNDLLSGSNGQSVLRIYAGTLPTLADDVTSGTQLASMDFGVTAFNVTTSADSSHGVLTLFSRLYDSNTDASGTPGWGLIEDGAGNKIMDFICPSDVTIGEIVVGGELTIRTFTLTVQAGADTSIGDLNLDGRVDIIDLGILSDNWTG